MTKFKKYIKSLTDNDLERYAKLCGTSVGYINTNLLFAHRRPRNSLWSRLVANSDGMLVDADMVEHFITKKVA